MSEYQPSIFEKIIPVLDNWVLAELKIQQLKSKKITHILPDHRRELEETKQVAAEEIFEIIHNPL